ncbi:MAG TPA: hypothetical protein V6C71_15215 [Coleofasciculaceae cyanobacterium]
MNSKQPFKWRHFQQEIILLNVRWYLRSLYGTKKKKKTGKSREEKGLIKSNYMRSGMPRH